MDGSTIVLIGNALLTPVLGVLGYMGKRTLDEIRQGHKDHETRITNHDTELQTIRQDLGTYQQDTCTKEDFVRESARTRQSLEQIMSRLDKDDGTRDAMIQIGAAVAAALNTRKEPQ